MELDDRQKMIAERVLKEINARLRFLVDVGLDYLSLDRAPARCPAARRSASGWPPRSAPAWSACSTCSTSRRIGLHQRDNHRLIETLVRLKKLGNTLIVVEHDEDTIRTADWIVDIGPGAGEHGGHIVHSGSVEDLLTNEESLDRRLPVRPQVDPDAGDPPARRRRAASWSCTARASTTCAT